MDWDGTLRPGMVAADWLSFLVESAAIPASRLEALWILKNDYDTSKVGYEEFAAKAVKLYASALDGVAYEELQNLSHQFAARDMSRLFPFAEALLNQLSAHGYLIFVITAAPRLPLCSYRLPIDYVFGLEIKKNPSGYLTNKIEAQYASRDDKELAVREIQKRGFTICLAFGDSYADTPLLEAARHSFVVGENLEIGDIKERERVSPQDILLRVAAVMEGL